MKLLARPLCVAFPREIDDSTLVVRLPPDIGTATIADVAPCGEGMALVFYRGCTTRRMRLVPLRLLVADEAHAAKEEGRGPRTVRAIVPAGDGEKWDVAEILDPISSPVDRVLAAVMAVPRGGA